MRSIDFTVPRTSGLADVAIEYWTKRLAYSYFYQSGHHIYS